jgi:hypothetical protein
VQVFPSLFLKLSAIFPSPRSVYRAAIPASGSAWRHRFLSQSQRILSQNICGHYYYLRYQTIPRKNPASATGDRPSNEIISKGDPRAREGRAIGLMAIRYPHPRWLWLNHYFTLVTYNHKFWANLINKIHPGFNTNLKNHCHTSTSIDPPNPPLIGGQKKFRFLHNLLKLV